MSTVEQAAEHAARNVPDNPRPLCRDFTEQPEPSAFWCGTCHWNRPMHDDEVARTAIAAELERIAGTGPCDHPILHMSNCAGYGAFVDRGPES